MLAEIQRAAMRVYKATSAQGVDYVRPFRFDEICCAVIIHPLEDGGGLFPEIQVDWYTDWSQAQRHADDWRKFGHDVEVVQVRDC